MRSSAWAALAVLAAAGAPAAAAGTHDLGAGTAVTAGTRGYARSSSSADVSGHLGAWEPYLWGQWDVDNYLWDIQGGVGTWKDVGHHVNVRVGLGGMTGRIADTARDESSFIFETGLERSWKQTFLGAGYTLTDGRIGGPTVPTSFIRTLHDKEPPVDGPGIPHGGASSFGQSYVYNELAAYARFPTGRALSTLELTVGMPSIDKTIYSETASVRLPLFQKLSGTAAVTVQQGPEEDVYGTLSVYWLFR